MPEKVRIKVAVAMTAMFIGVTSAAGLALHASHPPTPPVVSVTATGSGHNTAAARSVAPKTDHESND